MKLLQIYQHEQRLRFKCKRLSWLQTLTIHGNVVMQSYILHRTSKTFLFLNLIEPHWTEEMFITIFFHGVTALRKVIKVSRQIQRINAVFKELKFSIHFDLFYLGFERGSNEFDLSHQRLFQFVRRSHMLNHFEWHHRLRAMREQRFSLFFSSICRMWIALRQFSLTKYVGCIRNGVAESAIRVMSAYILNLHRHVSTMKI